jgi:iron complex transport system substrate-binding protein
VRSTRRETLQAAAAWLGGLLAWGPMVGCNRRSDDAGGPGARAKGVRVVSVSPNTTETLFALGAGSSVVGRSRYCDYPAEALALPVVGGFADPSFEAILALAPTLVVGDQGPAGPDLERRLRDARIATYFPAVTSVNEVHDMIEGIGERIGRSPEARTLIERLRTDVKRIASEAATDHELRALLVFDVSPIVVAGPSGYATELMALAGAHNVITRGGLYPMVGIEHLLAVDPDVVLDASATGNAPPGEATPSGGSSLANRPGWSELRAVRSGRVGVLRSSAALRPGPRLAEGLAEMAQALRTGVLG